MDGNEITSTAYPSNFKAYTQWAGGWFPMISKVWPSAQAGASTTQTVTQAPSPSTTETTLPTLTEPTTDTSPPLPTATATATVPSSTLNTTTLASMTQLTNSQLTSSSSATTFSSILHSTSATGGNANSTITSLATIGATTSQDSTTGVNPLSPLVSRPLPTDKIVLIFLIIFFVGMIVFLAVLLISRNYYQSKRKFKFLNDDGVTVSLPTTRSSTPTMLVPPNSFTVHVASESSSVGEESTPESSVIRNSNLSNVDSFGHLRRQDSAVSKTSRQNSVERRNWDGKWVWKPKIVNRDSDVSFLKEDV